MIGWMCGLIKRVCRCTSRAETHGMIYATEASDLIRAVTTNLRGKHQKGQRESTCANEINSVWVMDCQSLRDYSVDPVAQGSEDKRFEIDLESLWGILRELPDGRPKNDLRDTPTDKSRWISISTMLCEPLTKDGPTTSYAGLRWAMSTGVMDLSPTVESQMKEL